MKPAWLMAAGLFAAAGAPAWAGEALHLVAPGAAAGERLMGVRLKIDNGRVAALPDWPAGWRVAIDNDPSWHATLDAHATVGAAALPPAALAGLVSLAEPPEAAKSDLRSGPIHVSGEIVFMRDGEMRTVKLRSIAVAPNRRP